MALIKVVCAVVFKNDKILLCRRKLNKSLGGFWEFPGGKVEPGEKEEESLLRELREELGMQVSLNKYYKTVVYQYEKITVELIAYICQFQQASYVLIDHDKYEWVDRKELNNYKLAPADVPIAKNLVFYDENKP